MAATRCGCLVVCVYSRRGLRKRGKNGGDGTVVISTKASLHGDESGIATVSSLYRHESEPSDLGVTIQAIPLLKASLCWAPYLRWKKNKTDGNMVIQM